MTVHIRTFRDSYHHLQYFCRAGASPATDRSPIPTAINVE
jgi:hypothetical protein